jgi:hypothetical protein
MQSEPVVASTATVDDARLEALGYKPQLNRALGLFSNFAVARSEGNLGSPGPSAPRRAGSRCR